jgi:hypothetical protein
MTLTKKQILIGLIVTITLFAAILSFPREQGNNDKKNAVANTVMSEEESSKNVGVKDEDKKNNPDDENLEKPQNILQPNNNKYSTTPRDLESIEGWKVFSDDELGISLAYPQEFTASRFYFFEDWGITDPVQIMKVESPTYTIYIGVRDAGDESKWIHLIGGADDGEFFVEDEPVDLFNGEVYRRRIRYMDWKTGEVIGIKQSWAYMLAPFEGKEFNISVHAKRDLNKELTYHTITKENEDMIADIINTIQIH